MMSDVLIRKVKSYRKAKVHVPSNCTTAFWKLEMSHYWSTALRN